MEDILFNILLFMIAFSIWWFITKTFLKSFKEFKEWLLPSKQNQFVEPKNELTEEETEIENFDFDEKMRKGYLTAQEKEIFRKKYLKK